MKNIKGLKIVALIPPGLAIAVLLMFMIGETAGGDVSGLGHLIQAIPIALLMWLGWKRPLLGEPPCRAFFCRCASRTGTARAFPDHYCAVIAFRVFIPGRGCDGTQNWLKQPDPCNLKNTYLHSQPFQDDIPGPLPTHSQNTSSRIRSPLGEYLPRQPGLLFLTRQVDFLLQANLFEKSMLRRVPFRGARFGDLLHMFCMVSERFLRKCMLVP